MDPIKLASIETFAFRVPTKPIKVSFGTFRDRPCVLVRVVDVDGQEGWGEVWCNWPAASLRYWVIVPASASLPRAQRPPTQLPHRPGCQRQLGTTSRLLPLCYWRIHLMRHGGW